MQTPFHLPYVEDYTNIYGKQHVVRVGAIILEITDERITCTRPWWPSDSACSVKRNGNRFRFDGVSFNLRNIGDPVPQREEAFVDDTYRHLVKFY